MQDTLGIIAPNTVQCDTMEYRFDILQRSRLGSSATENKVQTTVEKQYIRDTEQGGVYRINTLDRQQEATSFLRSIEKDLAFLSQSIAVQTDNTGAIIRVLNLAEIKEKWEDYRHDFYKKHKGEKEITQIINDTDILVGNEATFTDTLKTSETMTLLFPEIYGQFSNQGQSAVDSKTFSSFFGKTALPLIRTTTVRRDLGLPEYKPSAKNELMQLEINKLPTTITPAPQDKLVEQCKAKLLKENPEYSFEL